MESIVELKARSLLHWRSGVVMVDACMFYLAMLLYMQKKRTGSLRVSKCTLVNSTRRV